MVVLQAWKRSECTSHSLFSENVVLIWSKEFVNWHLGAIPNNRLPHPQADSRAWHVPGMLHHDVICPSDLYPHNSCSWLWFS